MAELFDEEQAAGCDGRRRPTCQGAMRIVAFITQTAVIDQILTHLRSRARPPMP